MVIPHVSAGVPILSNILGIMIIGIERKGIFIAIYPCTVTPYLRNIGGLISISIVGT